MKKLILKMVVIVTAMLLPTMVFAKKLPDEAQKSKILNKTYRMQIPFIENRGQVEDNEVSFYAKTFGGTLFVGKDGTLIYSLPLEDKGGVVIKEVFTEKRITAKGLEPSPTRVNYFMGNDKSKWKANIPSYNSVSLGEVYKGIELTLKAYGNNVEKLFTVSAETNSEIIKIKLQGAKGLKVNKKGELEIITEYGSVKFTKPIAYQEVGGEKKPVEVAYIVFKRTTYGFKVGTYDKKRPLIIDPLLASTFIGGDSWDISYDFILDYNGNIYITGETQSSNYPITPGAYDESFNGDGDVFVSKLDSNLSTLLASTYIGGANNDYGWSLALDRSGNVYVTGYTESGYPTTPGAYDETHNGSWDVFISKLDSNLSTLLASTYIGGGNWEFPRSLALDGSGNVYVTGNAESGYPTTPSAYNESHNGGYYDVFISKLDSNLSTLLASTFIGGGGNETGFSLALDGSGNVYATGRAESGYPTTHGAYNESHNGGPDDVFISKLDSNLSTLLASTFIGGRDGEFSCSISLNANGNVYVAGATASLNYPTTSDAYDVIYNGGISDVFISRFNDGLTSLVASTFIGGIDADYGYSIVLDENSNVYIVGTTNSSNYPTTLGAFDVSYNNNGDVFVSKINSSLSILLTSTFLGGSGYEGSSYSITLNGNGDVYINGNTSSSNYPTIPGAYDESFNDVDFGDVFLTKLDNALSSDNENTTTTIEPTTTTTSTILPSAIPDTGQTKCYDNDSEIPCPQPGGSFYGQDAQYGLNTNSYTKLDENGTELPDEATEWVMVKDNLTGLIWERYSGTGCLVETWNSAVSHSQNLSLGGYNDWRLPTIKELSFIINRDLFEPSIDVDYFSTCHNFSRVYWSSTPGSFCPSSHWFVYFDIGTVSGKCESDIYAFERAVRGEKSGLFGNFIENGDGTVTDVSTRLIWQQRGAIHGTWEEALAYCDNLTFAGYNDWRLPNINELQSIVDYTQDNPCIDTDFFHNVKEDYYWSSTTLASSASSAWSIDFYTGVVISTGKSGFLYMWTVRGPVEVTTTTTTASSQPCTSETIYGERSEQTELLRYFRDNILSQTPEGQELIRLYYQWSPVIVKAMEGDEEFKEEVKEIIDGVLGLVGGDVE